MLTAKGIRQAFVLAFINVKTRRVVLSPATFSTNGAWVCEQAEAFVDQARADGLPVAMLMRDRDGAFTKAFDAAVQCKRVTVVKAQFRAPNMNAYAERFVQTIQQECLDHFVVFGARHMDHLCKEFVEHYHEERPHQGLENELLRRVRKRPSPGKADLPTLAEISCRSRLGGLLKSYHRRAA